MLPEDRVKLFGVHDEAKLLSIDAVPDLFKGIECFIDLNNADFIKELFVKHGGTVRNFVGQSTTTIITDHWNQWVEEQLTEKKKRSCCGC